MPRTLLPSAALVGAVALLTAGLALPAVAAGTTVTVLIADISDTNVSAASTKWDAASGAAAATLPATGTRWALDIENKPKGTSAITADGLVLTVETTPAPKKIRYQYYIGSGGYPAIDSQPHTLNDMLASEVSWDESLLSGETTYGPVFQVQLQRQLTGGAYARVTVQTVWAPGTGHRDLGAGLWFANTAIYADGYPDGATAGYATRPGVQVLNNAGSGPGVTAEVLKTNFGAFEVVSFGPNLGRDYAYSYAFQNLTAFGQTFVFSEHAPVVPSTPPAGGTTTPGGSSSATTTRSFVGSTGPAPTPTPTADDQLTTLAIPPAENSGSSESSEQDEADTPEAAADPQATASTNDFPWWLLILGGGLLVFLLALLAVLFRRRSA